MRIGAILLSCLLLGGCAMQAMAPQQAAQYRRVGIMSAMGEGFAASAVGLTVFGNEHRALKPEIGVDDLLTEKARQALSARYAVVDLSRYREAFLNTPFYWPGQNRIVGEDRPPAADVIRPVMGSEALDAYVFITPGGGSVRGTNQGVNGIGIVRRQRLLSTDEYMLHAAYIVRVVDGKNFEVAADMRAFPIGESSLVQLVGGAPLSVPSVSVPAELWSSPETHAAAIKQALDLLLAQSIPQTLRQARLLD